MSHGLIRATKQHKCSPPGIFQRIVAWFFDPIRIGSFYKCGTCGKVYELKQNRVWDHFAKWERADEENWDEALEKQFALTFRK